MASYTPNYNLKKPSQDDFFDVDDFNENADKIDTALNNKADTNLNNVDNNIDFIIDSQEPTAENNYTWYDLYKSGKVVQGGYNFLSAYVQNAYFVQTLPIPMADINYQVTVNFESKNQSYHAGNNFFLISDNYTTTTFNYCARGGDSRNYKVSSSWEVKGKANLT